MQLQRSIKTPSQKVSHCFSSYHSVDSSRDNALSPTWRNHITDNSFGSFPFTSIPGNGHHQPGGIISSYLVKSMYILRGFAACIITHTAYHHKGLLLLPANLGYCSAFHFCCLRL